MLITGASGFIGSWMADKLALDLANVTALVSPNWVNKPSGLLLDQKNIKTVEGLVQDVSRISRILNEFSIDTVFHFAANNSNIGTTTPPLSIFETNIRGTWCVLEACRKVNTVERIVIASSREAEIEGNIISDRIRLSRKHHPYQVSKISAELIAKAYTDTYNLPITISRTSNIYGGRDVNWNRLIPSSIRSLLNGNPPTLRSDGTITRDYMYIDDMVSAYKLLAENASAKDVKGQVISFETGKTYSAIDIVKIICELSDRKDYIPILLKYSHNESINKVRTGNHEPNVLGWKSRTTITEGLRLTLDWYRKYLHKL